MMLRFARSSLDRLIKRIGRDRFVRNVLYAIGNSGDIALKPVAKALANDPDPTVADACPLGGDATGEDMTQTCDILGSE